MAMERRRMLPTWRGRSTGFYGLKRKKRFGAKPAKPLSGFRRARTAADGKKVCGDETYSWVLKNSSAASKFSKPYCRT